DTLTYTASAAAYTLDAGANPATLTSGGTARRLSGFESFDFTGMPGTLLSVIGTPRDDALNVVPTGNNQGRLTGQLGGLAVTARNVSRFVVDGAAGTDTVSLTGTNGVDTVTSTGKVVTINGLNVDVGTRVERLNLSTLAGNDSVSLGLT